MYLRNEKAQIRTIAIGIADHIKRFSAMAALQIYFVSARLGDGLQRRPFVRHPRKQPLAARLLPTCTGGVESQVLQEPHAAV